MEDTRAMAEALAYSKMVKKRLHNRQETYHEFFSIMRASKSRKIDPESVASQVKTLFHGQNDLILGFNRFLPKEYAITVPEDDKSSSKVYQKVDCNDLKQFLKRRNEFAIRCKKFLAKRRYEKGLINIKARDENAQKVCDKPSDEIVAARKAAAIEYINRVRKILNNDQMYKKFLDAMAGYRRLRNLNRVEQQASTLFKASPELYIEFTTFLAGVTQKKSMWKKANQRVRRTRRNGHKKRVISLPEKIMNRFEDDMYEQDMLLHRLESAKEAMERLLEACEKNPFERINVDDHLSAIQIRVIERLYDESGPDMVETLRGKPGAASSTILGRLKQKYEELKEKRTEANRQRAKTIKMLHGKTEDPDEISVMKEDSRSASTKSHTEEEIDKESL